MAEIDIKMEYEFISFKMTDKKLRTTTWLCINNRSGSELGIIKWYGAWRQYCYFPTAQAVYSKGCLEDIAQFLRELITRHREKGNHFVPGIISKIVKS